MVIDKDIEQDVPHYHLSRIPLIPMDMDLLISIL